MQVGENKTFTILAKNNSDTHKYIQSLELNSNAYTKMYIDYKDIMAGGVLEFGMAEE